MKYRKLTADGDYSFGNNDNDFLTDTAALIQAIQTRLLLFYQEWWEDPNSGIPMFQNIIGQVNSSNITIALKSLVTKRIKEFRQVSTVSFNDIKILNRRLIADIECTLYSGEQIDFTLEV